MKPLSNLAKNVIQRNRRRDVSVPPPSRPFAQPCRPIADTPCGTIYSRLSMHGDLIEVMELPTPA